ncbi:hypothetical protein SLEP1_g55404 [Rubroshorea leprosula]|uniref:Uncharacterized protein n=1 Tax=Rubroshorea leprosula TaxID=152421 RepID=A0AAV5MJ50_9ROSI|nr:hypothetical protein SLEP1_g55404 [Rubroshorea leprosula]
MSSALGNVQSWKKLGPSHGLSFVGLLVVAVLNRREGKGEASVRLATHGEDGFWRPAYCRRCSVDVRRLDRKKGIGQKNINKKGRESWQKLIFSFLFC